MLNQKCPVPRYCRYGSCFIALRAGKIVRSGKKKVGAAIGRPHRRCENEFRPPEFIFTAILTVGVDFFGGMRYNRGCIFVSSREADKIDANILLAASLGANVLLCGALIGSCLHARKKDKRAYEKEENGKLFLRTVTHDLRSPLANIKGFAELLAAGTLSEEKSAEALALIASEADRLASVANRLTEGEDAPLSLSSFDLSECVHRLTLILDGKAKKRGVSFCEKGFSPDEPHYVRADERAIREVLYNLCDNAVKYADENTPVTVALSEDGGRVYASIENICRDFDPADGEKIFSAGYRGRSGTASIGSGLGLSIARSLLLRHGQECAPVFSFENGVLRISFSLEKAPEYSEYTEAQGEGKGKGE